ncbi:MAG: class I SAM-dependent methyltransferase [Pseudomonadota bacterium]|jgi:2-polyprenyl-3-methyl-5-hydroxy-6-metoxy-1,4-benzoquinol methylase|nr:class I SAM-dependent methyltransferase [Alphaproteobacteria bacterium]
MSTLSYYNAKALDFYDRTINTDMSHVYKKFLQHLPKGAHILDAGCGSGRDSKYFLSKGYEITAFDGSQEMVLLAEKELGKSVLHMLFQDLNFEEKFDGVWACASLLHIPYEETKDVYKRIHNALKPNGVFYASYKHVIHS